MTATMRAARLHELAQPFQIDDDVPAPQATGRDVVVKVATCGLVPNLKNITHYFGSFLPLPPLPAIFGLDPAGVVTAVGPDVTGIQVGTRVYVNPSRSCAECERCRAGEVTRCEAYTFAGYFGFGPGSREVFDRYPYGGFAEYTLAPEEAIVPLPDTVSFEDAAHLGYLGTSYAGLKRGDVGPGKVLLINGGTGTLGVGAVLLALAMGVTRILVVARNKDRLAKVKALAPDVIETHSTDDGSTTEWAKARTEGRGVDVVLDCLAPGTPADIFTQGMLSVCRGGTVVTIGGMLDPIDFTPGWLMTSGVSFLGSAWFTTQQAIELAELVASDRFDRSAYEHAAYPLEQVNDALDAALDRANGGFTNVFVTI